MNRKPCSRLWLYFTGVILATVAAVSLLAAFLWRMLFAWNVIQIEPRDRHVPVLVFLLGSVLLGTVIAFCVGRRIIRPIQNISRAFDGLSKGNFSVRVPETDWILEIREMAEHFNAMAYELSRIETLSSDFVANVSHEFKTPIAAIEGYATLLQSPNLTQERRDRYLEKILDNSRQLSGLSSNILALSKLENQEAIVDTGEFRLDEQIRKAILALESRWEAKAIEFDLDLPRQMYHGSEALLARVWSNLLDNAIKYSPRGGTVSVSLRQAGAWLAVSVGDQGDGMTAEVQRHIFEKFYQGDPSHKAEGSGLGLSLVRKIVALSGGTVTVESSPGNGAVFRVLLPQTS